MDDIAASRRRAQRLIQEFMDKRRETEEEDNERED